MSFRPSILSGVTDPHPHDHIFRAVFSSSENALGIFRAVLPPTVLAALEPASLELEEGSFVDDELRGQESDLLFRARLAGRQARLYVLVEHQSAVDPLMPLRLLRYVVRIWERLQRESREPLRVLPAVVPLVLFHGARPWSGPRRLADLMDLPDELKAALGSYVPAFELLIDDLAALDPAAVEARKAGLLGRLALVFMKAATGESDLVVLLDQLAALVTQLSALPNGLAGVSILIHYILAVRDIPRGVLEEHLRRILGPKVTGEIMVTTADRLRAEGQLEGQRRMLARMLEKKFGTIPPAVRNQIGSASVAELERWSDRLLSASSLEAVFASE